MGVGLLNDVRQILPQPQHTTASHHVRWESSYTHCCRALTFASATLSCSHWLEIDRNIPPSWNFSPRGVHPSSSHVLAVSSNLINGKPHITMDMTSWSIFYGKGCVSAGHFVMVIYMKYSCELYKTTGVLVCLSCVRRQVSVSASTCRNSRKSLPLRCKMRS